MADGVLDTNLNTIFETPLAIQSVLGNAVIVADTDSITNLPTYVGNSVVIADADSLGLHSVVATLPYSVTRITVSNVKYID